MNIPEDPALPFFAYGLFRPDQLAFHRLREFVVRIQPAEHRGELRLRDGLPILHPNTSGTVSGTLLYFSAGPQAYSRIIEIEPDKQYRWQESVVAGERANVLIGRSPMKGSEPAEDSWDGAHDPLFTSALQVVKEVADDSAKFEWNLKPMFRLQMAYLLLWSAIERFVSLKYHLGDDVWKKVQHLASEPAFVSKLHELNLAERSVFRADDPQTKVTLRNDPEKAVQYYYQVRSNITHRGKGVVKDHERVLYALRELMQLFEAVLDSAFSDRWRAG
jgi:hypothetical protein